MLAIVKDIEKAKYFLGYNFILLINFYKYNIYIINNKINNNIQHTYHIIIERIARGFIV